jgi:hypothetical protein
MTNETALAIALECIQKQMNRYYSEYGGGSDKSKAKYAELATAHKKVEAIKHTMKTQKTMF